MGYFCGHNICQVIMEHPWLHYGCILMWLLPFSHLLDHQHIVSKWCNSLLGIFFIIKALHYPHGELTIPFGWVIERVWGIGVRSLFYTKDTIVLEVSESSPFKRPPWLGTVSCNVYQRQCSIFTPARRPEAGNFTVGPATSETCRPCWQATFIPSILSRIVYHC